ncbi:MAG: hypothetical protein ABI041_11895 [Bdellovibrionia bacterium]
MKNLHYVALIAGMVFNVQAFAKTPGAVKSFSLVDADTSEVIEEYKNIEEGMAIDLGQVSAKNLSIKANTKGKVKSVQFGMDSSYTYLAGKKPFYLCGGDVTPCTNLSVGFHQLSGTPFTEINGGGVKGNLTVLNFSIINSGPGTMPLPTPTPEL